MSLLCSKPPVVPHFTQGKGQSPDNSLQGPMQPYQSPCGCSNPLCTLLPQGLCTCCPLCLECTSPNDCLTQPLISFKSLFKCHLLIGAVLLTLPISLSALPPKHFLPYDRWYSFSTYVSPIPTRTWAPQDQGFLFCSPLYLQHQGQTLALSRHSVSVCGMNEWALVLSPSPLPQPPCLYGLDHLLGNWYTWRTNKSLTASIPGLPYLQMKGLDQIIGKVLPTLKTFNWPKKGRAGGRLILHYSKAEATFICLWKLHSEC